MSSIRKKILLAKKRQAKKSGFKRRSKSHGFKSIKKEPENMSLRSRIRRTAKKVRRISNRRKKALPALALFSPTAMMTAVTAGSAALPAGTNIGRRVLMAKGAKKFGMARARKAAARVASSASSNIDSYSMMQPQEESKDYLEPVSTVTASRTMTTVPEQETIFGMEKKTALITAAGIGIAGVFLMREKRGR